jgi:hypothetical protein
VDHDARHLNSATADFLVLSVEERIRAIRADRWVQYPRARQVLGILSHVLEHPRTTRMPFLPIALRVSLLAGVTIAMRDPAQTISRLCTRTRSHSNQRFTEIEAELGTGSANPVSH